MIGIRVIPCLLLQGKGLVKTTQFKNPVYLGDPLNVINIFNKKMVDELILLDIAATKDKREPNFDLIKRIASVCFSPLTYGGGIRTLNDAETLFKSGVEKVCINTNYFLNKNLIVDIAKNFGNQSVIISVNISRNILGKYKITDNFCNPIDIKLPIKDYFRQLQDLGAGEIFINDVDRDGTMKGYDTDLLKIVTSAVNIPVIACGGAGNLDHFKEAVSRGEVSAVAAGSFFVFNGPHKAVLISYPSQQQLKELLETKM